MIAALERLAARLRACFQSRALEADFEEELTCHLEMLTEENVRSGYSPAEARRRAKQQLGGLEQTREAHRQARGLRWLEQFARDLKSGARQILANQGFAAACIFTIALAIAACATVFSVLDGILYRPLPYGDSDKLVTIWEVAEYGRNSVSPGAYIDWRDNSQSLESLMLFAPTLQNLRRNNQSEVLMGTEVSASFLEVLQISPIIGRGFLPSEEQVGGPPVAIITEELWRSHFGAEESILGSTILLDEQPRQVVGVLPADAWIDPPISFLVPLAVDPSRPGTFGRGSHWTQVWGRLEPGVSPEALQAELRGIKASLASEYPEFKQEWSVEVTPLRDWISEEARPALWTLAAAVGLVLLIACSNVANLLLAKGTGRMQELAMRAALGASRRRIVLQSLTESGLLACVGGVIGLVLAVGGIQLFRMATSDMLPGALAPTLDGRVLLASIVITCGSTLLFGLIPAIAAGRADPNTILKNGGKSSTSGGRNRTQSLFVVGEIAFTVALLASAGLLLKSLANRASEDPGYNPEGVITFDLNASGERFDSTEKRLAYLATAREKIAALPSVSSVAALSASPLQGGFNGEYVSRSDRPDTRFDRLASISNASDGFFETLQARLIAGRFFAPSDNRPDAARVAVIDRTLAERLFGEDSAIGESVACLGNSWQVIGVVDNLKLDPGPRPDGYLFMPHAFSPFRISIVARGRFDAEEARTMIQNAVKRVDSTVAMASFRTMEEALSNTRREQRFILMLIGGFAGSGLLLACTGLYGVMAYTTAARQRELGIRRALGATSASIARLIARDASRMTLSGLVLGLLAAFAAARLLSPQLHDVSPHDPLILSAIVTAIAAIAAIACWTPARRAIRADPTAGLRSE